MLRFFRFGCFLLLAGGTAASQPRLWEDRGAAVGRPVRNFRVDHPTLRSLLASAASRSSTHFISLPTPDGSQAQFSFVEAPIMDPALAARFPEIKTYSGQGMDDSTATVRFDLTPHGFHAQVLSPRGAFYVEQSASGETNLHICYYKRDRQRTEDGFRCSGAVEESAKADGISTLSKPAQTSTSSPSASSVVPGNLRIYRLACAATGEYTRYFGGTVAKGLAAIVTAINRVDGIYETELGIRLVLVANNDRLVYTNSATDPYTDGSPATLLAQNQSNLDALIGSASYDIGHVFGTGGGGLAGVAVVGTPNKAYGETGISAPVGDAFYVDYVAHEIGHQFGAHHTFNGLSSGCSASRFAATAFEPGSGSTIMSYAGVCGSDNLQGHSDSYFHSASIEEIAAFVSSGAGSRCAVVTNTLNNPPVVYAGGAYVIPRATPFTLAASGSDPDGDTLVYTWEERDLGSACSISSADTGANPLFRSFAPDTAVSRTFPKLSALLAGTISPGETFPTTSRTMQFRVTARDHHSGGGLTASADVQVVVETNAGPFRFTSPTTSSLTAGSQLVTWDAANTAATPVNATTVNILLSTNGGVTFPIMLASNVPNAGMKLINLPWISTSAARFQIQAASNIFFCLSPTNFSILPGNGSSVASVPAPTLTYQAVSGQSMAFCWPATTGRTYRVQYKDMLTSTNWFDLQPEVTATTNSCVFSASTGEAPQRFFRVLALP